MTVFLLMGDKAIWLGAGALSAMRLFWLFVGTIVLSAALLSYIDSYPSSRVVRLDGFWDHAVGQGVLLGQFDRTVDRSNIPDFARTVDIPQAGVLAVLVYDPFARAPKSRLNDLELIAGAWDVVHDPAFDPWHFAYVVSPGAGGRLIDCRDNPGTRYCRPDTRERLDQLNL